MYSFLNCAGVRSCYDEGKRTAETLSMDYHRGLNLEVAFLIKKVTIFLRIKKSESRISRISLFGRLELRVYLTHMGLVCASMMVVLLAILWLRCDSDLYMF